MTTTFEHRGLYGDSEPVPYRVATTEEIAARPDGHVFLGCTCCGQATWMCKGIAVNDAGGYTGARNIFYLGKGAECSCPVSALRMIVPQED
jgi:hypothetical protein